MTQAHEIRLKSRPVGLPQPEHFELATAELPAPAAGEVQVRNLFMSVDPYMRGRMYDRPSYVPPFQIGKVLEGGAIGEVTASNGTALRVGDLVSSMFGWRTAFNAPAEALQKLPATEGVPPQAFLGVLGMPGLTAWAGLTQIGEPKPGETVFVSGGAGAVGSVVAQIAKIKGCTVVATAGSDEKCQWLREAGIDHAINYKTCGNLLEAVRAAAPKGIDVYFDNVGGEHLEVAIELARPFARLVECGMIANYNATEPTPGPRNIIMVVGKSLKMQGFIVTQFAGLQPQFLAQMSGWIAEGRIRWEETIHHGIDQAPAAFAGLFSGGNTGKMLVKL
jgi:NADPH-dependent curcumin reductase CurA